MKFGFKWLLPSAPPVPPELEVPQPRFNWHSPIDGSPDPLRMIYMRLRLPEGMAVPFHISAARKTDKDWIVFVLHGDTPVTIEEPDALFPSDALIGQLRLLLQ